MLLTACGGGGGGGGGGSSPTAPLVLSVSLSSDSQTIELGNSITLTWSSSNASSCSASANWDGGNKSTSGSESFTPSSLGTQTITITCTGSGSSSSASVTVTVVEAKYDITGTVKTMPSSDIDGDVPNPEYPKKNNNLDPLNAQLILNPTQLIGYANINDESSEVSDDQYDIYEIALVGNQYAILEISEWNEDDPNSIDLDILIFDEEAEIIGFGVSTDWYERVTLPEAGTYYVVVVAESGSSKYVLSVGSAFSGYSVSNYSSDVGIIPRTGIVSLKKESDKTSITSKEKEFLNKVGVYPNLLDTEEILIQDFITPEIQYFNRESMYRNLFMQLGVSISDEMMENIVTKKVIGVESNLHENILIEVSPKFSSMGAFSPDPDYKYQWDLLAINTEEAINAIGSDTNSAVVAVLDSGRPTISSPAYKEIDYVSGGYDFVVMDTNAVEDVGGNYHGSHVAGTIAAKNNGRAINGMGVKALPIKVLGKDGGSFQGIIEATKYAMGLSNSSGSAYTSNTNKVVAINMSLGACAESVTFCNALTNLVEQTGIPIIAAAGNCTCNRVYSPAFCPEVNIPASCEGVISVAATDAENIRAYYSSYHPSVDIAGPGGDISIDKNNDGQPDGILSFGGDAKYALYQGTSMASPHVAAAVALMQVANSDLKNSDIESILADGGMTIDINDTGKDQNTGMGLLDVAKAVESAVNYEQNSSSTNANAAPTPTILNYGFTSDSLQVTLSKYGSGSLSVEGLAADEPEGLTYTGPSTSDGMGTYTIYIDRTDSPKGSYQRTIYFNLSNSTQPRVMLTFSVGDEREAPDMGRIYALLFDADTEEVIASQELDLSTGEGDYSFTDLSSGKYKIYVGSDIDDDNTICGWGEVCDYFPNTDTPTFDEEYTLDRDLIVDFNLIPISALGFDSLSSRISGNYIKFEEK